MLSSVLGKQVKISQPDKLGSGNTPIALDEWVEIRDPRSAASSLCWELLEIQMSVVLPRTTGARLCVVGAQKSAFLTNYPDDIGACEV